ncbi:hypothetical protein [Alicyclobacillus fodiniaquatilis]|uniref:Uncharacterized protein n=1 Tax=Alicyclobacillus fodiniaquatilis TaxID=1661150 RepID=A0ABW4JHB3_9BACL
MTVKGHEISFLGESAHFKGINTHFFCQAFARTREQLQADIIRLFMDKPYDVSVGYVLWREGIEFSTCLAEADAYLYERKQTQVADINLLR